MQYMDTISNVIILVMGIAFSLFLLITIVRPLPFSVKRVVYLFKGFPSNKSQKRILNRLYLQEKKISSELKLKNEDLQKQIQRLKNQINNQTNTNHSSKRQNTQDNRTAMEIMGVSNCFTAKELKDAYKRLTSRYHPDKHIHMSVEFKYEAECEFSKIQNAYNKIK